MKVDIFDIRAIVAQQFQKVENGLPRDELYLRTPNQDRIRVLTTGGYIGYSRAELDAVLTALLDELS